MNVMHPISAWTGERGSAHVEVWLRLSAVTFVTGVEPYEENPRGDEDGPHTLGVAIGGDRTLFRFLTRTAAERARNRLLQAIEAEAGSR